MAVLGVESYGIRKTHEDAAQMQLRHSQISISYVNAGAIVAAIASTGKSASVKILLEHKVNVNVRNGGEQGLAGSATSRNIGQWSL